MIRCDTCTKEFEDDTPLLVCDRCGARLEKPAAAALIVRNELPREANPAGPRTTEVYAEPPRRADRGAEPVREVLRTEPVRPTRPAEAETDLDPHHLDTITEYGKAKTIVAVIGFGASGKSFFVNRLRDQLPRGAWRAYPPPEKNIPISPEGLVLTQLVPDEGPRRRDQSYVVVDCAGESFAQALERQRDTRSLEGSAARSYLTAISFASAYVLVIRAEDLLTVSRGNEETLSAGDKRIVDGVSSLIDRFYEVVSAIVVAKDRLQKQKPQDFLRQGISREEISAAFERRRERCQQPLLVALAQADRLDPDGNDRGYDADPFLFAVQHGQKLFNAIHRSFEHYRFEFVSAFYGHDGSTRPNYKIPSYGAVEAFEWIHRQIGTPKTRLLLPFRIARGDVPTRYVVGLRRRIDPAFRKEWEA